MPTLAAILQTLQASRSLTTKQVQAIGESLGRYNTALGQDLTQKLTDKLLGGLKDLINPVQSPRIADDGTPTTVTTGPNPAEVRAGMQTLLDKFAPESIADTMNLDFHIKTGTDVAWGAGNYLQGNLGDVVEEYPAWELTRFEPRHKPRLWKGDEGTEDSSLGSGFASRWMFAAQAANDPDAARMLEEQDRMVALKSSGIWQQLGEFDDGLGNPYPPFAFNSGMWTQDVSRAECERLGLIGATEPARPAELAFDKLFAFGA